MPKRLHYMVTLPMEKPDCCAECPLVGIIPKNERPHGSKETHVCLGTHEALSGRGIKVRASEKDSHHPLRRPCDGRWRMWATLPGRQYAVRTEYYQIYRLPYEQGLQMVIKFHKRKTDDEQ